MKIILQLAAAALGVYLVGSWPWQHSTEAQHAAIGGLMGFGAVGGFYGAGWLYDRFTTPQI